MPLIYRKKLNLTEKEIRYAMAHSLSNQQAANFLGCHVTTYKRYAKMFIDELSQKSLWDIHKNPTGKGIKKTFKEGTNRKKWHSFKKKADLFEILDGLRPSYDKANLAKRLIEDVIFPEQCNNCGFEERRITDYKVPLLLTWKDGDTTNHKKDNLEFLCYNCFFLTYDNVFKSSTPINFKGI